jgi:hypothetical protein
MFISTPLFRGGPFGRTTAMKPFARLFDALGQDRAAVESSKQAQLERRWVMKDGKLECRYVMVRAN